MDENSLLSQLEELAQALGIDVRYEAIRKEGTFYPGGLCRLKGEHVLILNNLASKRNNIETLARAVAQFDLSGVYVRPGLREFLDGLQK